MDNESNDGRAAAHEIGLGAQQPDLAVHVEELLIRFTGVLRVDDPDDALLGVLDDQVEVHPFARRAPPLSNAADLLVRLAEVVDLLSECSFPGDASDRGMDALRGVGSCCIALEGLRRERHIRRLDERLYGLG